MSKEAPVDPVLKNQLNPPIPFDRIPTCDEAYIYHVCAHGKQQLCHMHHARAHGG